MTMDSIAEFNRAMVGKLDVWVPANGGTEPVFFCNGRRYQYMFNPAKHRHAYYDVDWDLVLDGELAVNLPKALRS
jgi:hypothetical protein